MRNYLLNDFEITRKGPKHDQAGNKFEIIQLKLIMKSSGDTSVFHMKDIIKAVEDQFKTLTPKK